ncbi:MAG: carbonic anhydrase [Candidatus Gracilibacteria bacterium]
MSHGSFATVINCMDGRTQLPVNTWIKQKYGVDYVDTVTEPGPDGILAKNEDQATLASMKKRVAISVEKHGSKTVVIVAHAECAGNPVSEAEHKEHVKKAMQTVKNWGFPVKIAAVWVGDAWTVEEVNE